jgi:hypothetical protein
MLKCLQYLLLASDVLVGHELFYLGVCFFVGVAIQVVAVVPRVHHRRGF